VIEGLKPYPEYKESGLPWLGKFPAHWELIPNRALFQEQRKLVGKNAAEYTLLSLTLGGIIPRNMETPKGKFPAQFNTYKVVRPEDLVFCLFDIDETPRGVGHSKLNGMITGAYDVFTPKPRANARYLYLYYLFLDEGKLLKPLYTGLRKTIRPGDFASVKTPCPKADEQDAIVRFLEASRAAQRHHSGTKRFREASQRRHTIAGQREGGGALREEPVHHHAPVALQHGCTAPRARSLPVHQWPADRDV
jgi:type I restriction enzyme S subunit